VRVEAARQWEVEREEESGEMDRVEPRRKERRG